MAKDRYPLAPVRGVRQQATLVRRGELATALGEAQTAEEAWAISRTRTSEARALLAQARATRHQLERAAAAELARHDCFIARCRRDVEAMVGAEARARATYDVHAGTVDAARATLSDARAEREVIERHFARWRETQRKLAERRDD